MLVSSSSRSVQPSPRWRELGTFCWSHPRLQRVGLRDFTVRSRYDLLSRPCPKVRSLQGCLQPASGNTVARTVSGLNYGSN